MSAYEALTEKQRQFVEAYLVHGNATQAYLDAGYQIRSNASARAASSRLLTRVNIQRALAERRTQLATAHDVTPERVIAELALIGFSDMHAYATWGPAGVTLRDSAQIDAAARRVVSEVSQTVTKDGGTIRFKLHNKIEALEKLGTHLGLWKPQTVAEAMEWLQNVQDARHLLQQHLRTLAARAHSNGHHDPDDALAGA